MPSVVLSQAEVFDEKLGLCASLENASTPEEALILIGQAVKEIVSRSGLALDLAPSADLKEIQGAVLEAYRKGLGSADEEDKEYARKRTQLDLEEARKLAAGIENYESYSVEKKAAVLKNFFRSLRIYFREPHPSHEKIFIEERAARLEKLKKDIAHGEHKLKILEKLGS